MNAALAELNDIHLPASEAWWHLAWGWWLLLALCVGLAIGLWMARSYVWAWYRKRLAYKALKHDIQSELAAMRQQYAQSHDGLALLRAISTFLRRVSISVFAREQSAGLIADEWLLFLDKQWGEEAQNECFSSEINANLLKYTAYKHEIDKNIQLDIEKLADLSEKWAMKVLKDYV